MSTAHPAWLSALEEIAATPLGAAAFRPAEVAAERLDRCRKLAAEALAHADRLRTCWTACEGFSTEALQDGAPAKLREDRDRLLIERAELLEALAAVLPYAESRAEDLSDHKEAGNEDPAYPGAAEAWEAVERARALVEGRA